MDNKPISIVIEDFKRNIANVVNTSGLHPSIVEPIFAGLYAEIKTLAERQLEMDKEQYEKQNKETTEE